MVTEPIHELRFMTAENGDRIPVISLAPDLLDDEQELVSALLAGWFSRLAASEAARVGVRTHDRRNWEQDCASTASEAALRELLLAFWCWENDGLDLAYGTQAVDGFLAARAATGGQEAGGSHDRA